MYKNRKYWEISFDRDRQVLITRYGTVDGKERQSEMDVFVNLSGRTLEEQATLEALQRIKNKARQGYTFEGMKIEKIFEPMKAVPFSEKITFPVDVQPKLDGKRSIGKMEDDKVVLFSKLGTEQPFFEHIKNDVKKMFSYLKPNMMLDGELYSHEINKGSGNFNLLMSILQTKNERNPKETMIRYYIFDLVADDATFEERYKVLIHVFKLAKPKYCILVPTFRVYSLDDLWIFYRKFMEEGYEGIMIRKPDGLYEYKRSKNLMKFKQFQDEETLILNVIPGEGSEKDLGLLVIKHPGGHQGAIRARGDFEIRREWLIHPEDVIGKYVTVRFQGLTPDKNYRFPVGIGIRNED